MPTETAAAPCNWAYTFKGRSESERVIVGAVDEADAKAKLKEQYNVDAPSGCKFRRLRDGERPGPKAAKK